MDQDRPGWNPPAYGDGPDWVSPPAFTHEPEVLEAAPAATPTAPRRRLGAGVAVAAIAIGGLAVAGTAYAATSSPSPSPTGGASQLAPGYGPGQDGPRAGGPRGGFGRGDHDGPGGFGRGFGPGMGMGGAIHGSFVVPKQGGGYQTIESQRGTVKSVSQTSLTVTSADGFEATYVVTADTAVNAQRDGIGSVKSGDEVMVTAVKDSGGSTAVSVVDLTGLKSSHDAWAPPAPAPSATQTS
ncbi:MAG: hypothetical protein GC157_16005 [Frankiales bacterium]|nr:hypothetical protein [Frankiales bacterium]